MSCNFFIPAFLLLGNRHLRGFSFQSTAYFSWIGVSTKISENSILFYILLISYKSADRPVSTASSRMRQKWAFFRLSWRPNFAGTPVYRSGVYRKNILKTDLFQNFHLFCVTCVANLKPQAVIVNFWGNPWEKYSFSGVLVLMFFFLHREHFKSLFTRIWAHSCALSACERSGSNPVR